MSVEPLPHAHAQGIAYAPLATRPTISGLYTAFFPVLIYALLGTSRSLSLGPEIITSTLIGQARAQMADGGWRAKQYSTIE